MFAQTSTAYVRYSSSVEEVGPNEDKTHDAIVKAMRDIMDKNVDRYGHAVQPSHGKSHGVVTGELTVEPDLPEPLAQGLFAESRTYPVIVRMATAPAELYEDDSGIKTPPAFAIKVLDAAGPKIAEHDGGDTQDFLLVPGKVFPAANAKVFLATIGQLDATAKLPEQVKAGVSALSRATNMALHAVGPCWLRCRPTS